MSKETLEVMVGGTIPLEIGAITEIKLLELLGTGGFGSVWKVSDSVTNNLYALKIIQSIKPGSEISERIRLEAEVSIPSEYIIPVIGFQQWDDRTYLLLFQYFPGKSLDQILSRNTLTKEQKFNILQQILIGVSDAHRCNIIHRDLKPANILVNEENQIKLIDFGISKFKEEKLTKDGQVMGTLNYIPPELLLYGAKFADARTDIYALGHIFYELAMGQHFWIYKRWRGMENFVDYLKQIPAPTSAIDFADFSCDFCESAASIISRMVKIKPEERFSSVNEILTELGYHLYIPQLPKDLHLRYPLLIVESGSNKGARMLVKVPDGKTLKIGRLEIAGNDLSISRNHLEFSCSGTQYFVRDLGSKNGTLLRGLALKANDQPIPINHTDRIKVGDIFLRFVFLN
jgi:serine/threonine-protein kinase